MSDNKYITVKGVRVNNLKNLSVNIPLDRFIVVSGVSGSGKSSFAFDTLYAEGQRRYVESLSSYARQFMGRIRKPECDSIKGIPPAIAIEQKVCSKNSRSTVGTSTEIYDYLRLLYARIGHTYSPISGEEVKRHSIEDIYACLANYAEKTKFAVVAPIAKELEGNVLQQKLKDFVFQGYTRLMVNNEFVGILDYIENNGEANGSNGQLFLVIDRMSVDLSPDGMSRLTDSVETAFLEGKGACRLIFMPSMIAYDFSHSFEADGMTFEEPNDRMFSFNSPTGACPECQGFGNIIGIDEKLVIPNTALSVYDGCVVCWHGEKMKEWKEEFCRMASNHDFPIFAPYYQLTTQQRDWLWHGFPEDNKYQHKVCIDGFFQMVKENQYKIQYRVMLSRYRGKTICPVCHGTRLKKEASYVKIAGRSITDITQMPINKLKAWFDNLQLTPNEALIGKRLLKEIHSRLAFLLDVGLGYLTLDRLSSTLSGGESQRINLTTSLGSSLVGSLYILDEPSIGLHSRDTQRLIKVFRQLRDQGNTVIVVEHDEEIITASDYLIDIGPDAGVYGGELVYEGPVKDVNDTLLKKFPKSYTLKYLHGISKIEVPVHRRKWDVGITVKGARMNNLKGIDVFFPLHVFTAVAGISGSGKSTLIKGILYPALKRAIGDVCDAPGDFLGLEGNTNAISKVEYVDQNPLGKSTRSNPVTYIKAYDAIRDLFAEQPLSVQMGYTSQYFSFNTEGGRCEECKGAGEITIEMQFMADITLECQCCHGKRFKQDILEVKFAGKNISDVLEMSVSEAMMFFRDNGQAHIADKLQVLENVGLGYIKLGQSSSTLSGGENQRVKLAYYISQEKQTPTMFIFDEPTTGLHLNDIQKLLNSFNTLIEHGHTVIVIEHHLDVIKCADYVIDMGPEGGEKGGEIVAVGTPEEICACNKSITGQYLKSKIER